jgi:hypothetical protein
LKDLIGEPTEQLNTFLKFICQRCSTRSTWSASKRAGNGLAEVNIIAPASFALVGLGGTDFVEVLSLLGTPIISNATYSNRITTQIAPVVHAHETQEVHKLHLKFQGQMLSVIVDGRYDSSRNAEFCNIAFMDANTSLIIWMETIDHRSCCNIAQRMEAIGIFKGLLELHCKYVDNSLFLLS